jgi:hypothetical protein
MSSQSNCSNSKNTSATAATAASAGSGGVAQSRSSLTDKQMKIAHRTRSKLPLNDKSLLDFELQLPDDLLAEGGATGSQSERISPGGGSSSNLAPSPPSRATPASTPASVNDPNDEIWFEFLSSLHEPIDMQTTRSSSSPERTATSAESQKRRELETAAAEAAAAEAAAVAQMQQHYATNLTFHNTNRLIDIDDPQQDPDFTICLEQYDELEEPDEYIDDWLQVPSKYINNYVECKRIKSNSQTFSLFCCCCC